MTDAGDVLALLQYRAANSGAAAAGAPCAPIGSDDGVTIKGDLNCDGLIDGGDTLIALRVWGGLPVAEFLPDGCPGP